jgi:aminoglycoside 2''-phosphotransferase
MSARGRNAIIQQFESFLDETSNFHYTPVFRHGDPGPGNVLFDAESGSLSGIIDFDFAGFGDPAVDWSIALEPILYGEEFVGRLGRRFPQAEATLARAKFYRGTWIVQEALRTFNAGELEAFNREIASYQ